MADHARICRWLIPVANKQKSLVAQVKAGRVSGNITQRLVPNAYFAGGVT